MNPLEVPPIFGLYRYGHPYTYKGTYYRPDGYYKPSDLGDPYGYGTSFYGGKQQTYSCKVGCLSLSEKDQNKCMSVCEAYIPYYNYDGSYEAF